MKGFPYANCPLKVEEFGEQLHPGELDEVMGISAFVVIDTGGIHEVILHAYRNKTGSQSAVATV